MLEFETETPPARRRRSEALPVLAVFLLALAVNVYGLAWGLPNGNTTWAADAIKPGAPLSVLYRMTVADGWNSGWFWFKYPAGHVFVLGAAYAPYLLWLLATGGLDSPTSEYPYGFAEPDVVLATLAMLGRSVSAVMGAGCAALVYLCLVRAFGRLAATAGALIAALCYPVLYYSHTTNVEVPYLFWMLLALLAAVRLAEGEIRRGWWIVLGGATAMSVSTKELAAGAFIAVPVVLLVIHLIHRRPFSQLLRGGVTAAIVCMVTFVVANNGILNPTGMLNRIGYLTQTLPREVALEYAPYYFPIDLGGSRGLDVEWAQFSLAAGRVIESLGIPTLLLAAYGLVVALRRAPAWTFLVVGLATGYYALGVRAMLSLSLRYVLPLAIVGCMLAGIGLERLAAAGGRAVWRRALAFAAVVFVVLYGWDVNRMMAFDGRYEAERWIAANIEETATVEVYQRPTYLPRFPAWVNVDEVDFEERGAEAFRQRSPEYVVLSSAGRAGVTVRYKKDWQSEDGGSEQEYLANQVSVTGEVMNYRRRDNDEFLGALEAGKLGYEEAGRFVVDPWIDRPLIQSLNPEITIYRRTAAATRSTAAASPTQAHDPTAASPSGRPQG